MKNPNEALHIDPQIQKLADRIRAGALDKAREYPQISRERRFENSYKDKGGRWKGGKFIDAESKSVFFGGILRGQQSGFAITIANAHEAELALMREAMASAGRYQTPAQEP